MRCNVDLLKIIQVGLTLADEEGNYPQDVTTWQFNFLFSVKYVKPLGRLQRFWRRWSSDDMYAPESIELLQKSGIDFQRHEEIGILPNDFAELMITSGLVLAPETKWISFHRWVLQHVRRFRRSKMFHQFKHSPCPLHCCTRQGWCTHLLTTFLS